MRRVELVMSLSRRVNMGNYEHVEAFVSEKVNLEGEETPEAVAPTVVNELREALRKALTVSTRE